MQLSHADRNHPTLSHIAQNLVLPRPLPKLMISTVLAGWVSSLPLHNANLEYKIAIFVSEPPHHSHSHAKAPQNVLHIFSIPNMFGKLIKAWHTDFKHGDKASPEISLDHTSWFIHQAFSIRSFEFSYHLSVFCSVFIFLSKHNHCSLDWVLLSNNLRMPTIDGTLWKKNELFVKTMRTLSGA